MSNHLAIASVTKALCQLLGRDLDKTVAGAKVFTNRPEKMAENTTDFGVNVYLYQTTPHATLRNADLPSRRDDGTIAQRPRMALNLFYLLTFQGSEQDLQPQRIMGSVLRTLHSYPLLTRQLIRDTNNATPYLKNSDLDQEIEAVKLTPVSLSLEELSKIWSVFFQVPHTLAVAYKAAVVFIDSEEIPQPALPVRERRIVPGLFQRPLIERIVCKATPNQPVVIGGSLSICGSHLYDSSAMVRIGAAEIKPSSVSDEEVEFTLAHTGLRAGVVGAQVIHRKPIDGAVQQIESNAVPIVVCPTITALETEAAVPNPTGAGFLTNIKLTLAPTMGKSQKATLLLNENVETAPQAYSFDLAPLESDANQITFAVKIQKLGNYFVHLQLGGAVSPTASADLV